MLLRPAEFTHPRKKKPLGFSDGQMVDGNWNTSLMVSNGPDGSDGSDGSDGFWWSDGL